MKSVKQQRLEKRILRLLADVYTLELKNPKIGFVTFRRCELVKEGTQLNVYVSIYEDQDKKNETFGALKKARNYFKGKVGKTIRLRTVPEIHFEVIDLQDEIPSDQLMTAPQTETNEIIDSGIQNPATDPILEKIRNNPSY